MKNVFILTATVQTIGAELCKAKADRLWQSKRCVLFTGKFPVPTEVIEAHTQIPVCLLCCCCVSTGLLSRSPVSRAGLETISNCN